MLKQRTAHKLSQTIETDVAQMSSKALNVGHHDASHHNAHALPSIFTRDLSLFNYALN